MTRNKFRALLAAVATAGLLSVAGFAWAAFNATGTSGGVQGGAEKFQDLTVAGQWLGGVSGQPLLPGESGRVKLTITNQATNTVNARVVTVQPVPLDVLDIGGGLATGARADCLKELDLAQYAPRQAIIVASGAQRTLDVVLNNAVALKSTADESCQGMTFRTRWRIVFRATREAPTAGTPPPEIDPLGTGNG